MPPASPGVIEDLAAQGTAVNHPLLQQADEINTIAYVVITSDRGLAGPFNSSVIRAAEREVMAAQTEGKDYRLILIGKKSRDYFKFRNYNIHSFFEWHDRLAHLRDGPRGRRPGPGDVRGRRGPAGRADLPGVRLHGHPAGGRPSLPAARVR